MERKAKTNDDSTAIEQEEILTQQLADEVEKQIVAQDSHDDYYDNRQIIPADNVDADGVPWATVGENIRRGVNGKIDKAKALEMISALIGTTVSVEEVTCTIKPKENITVDNPLFNGHTIVINIDSKTIVGFFVTKSSISEGTEPIYLRNHAGFKNSIQMRSAISSSLSGTVTLVVLVA